MDKLRAKIVTQQEIREFCALIFTETWLSEKVPEHAFSYRLTPYTEETGLQPSVRLLFLSLLVTSTSAIYRLCFLITINM